MLLLISLLSRAEAIPWAIALLIAVFALWIVVFYIILGGEPRD